MAECKYPNEVCANMTVLNGVTYCDSVPCSLKDEIPKQTNADRIRSMTDEELAEFLIKVYCESAKPCMEGNEDCKWEDYPTHDKGCKDCFKEWLQKDSEV